MAKILTLKCPECQGTWDWMRHPSDEPFPERCELCNAWMGDGPEVAPVLHLKIGSHKGKTPDQLYRRMEAASAARAEEAAEMSGASASEMGAIKITDMKDNMREGDSAVVTAAASAASRNLSYTLPMGTNVAPAFQNYGQEQANAMRQEASTGPNALATRRVINQMPHQAIAARMTAAGNDGKRH